MLDYFLILQCHNNLTMVSCILVASCNISWSISFSLMKKSFIFLSQCSSFTFSPWWIVALISTMVVLSPSNSCYSLDAPLFTCFWNSILTFSIHFLLSLFFPIVQILCNTIHVNTISTMCHKWYICLLHDDSPSTLQNSKNSFNKHSN
jgi:hypothetical protein